MIPLGEKYLPKGVDSILAGKIKAKQDYPNRVWRWVTRHHAHGHKLDVKTKKYLVGIRTSPREIPPKW